MLSLSTRDIAETILNRYPKDVDIEKIEVAGPGFLNFFLSKEYLLNKVESISKNGISQLDLDEGKKYIIEYTDPNPFKILHIGHLYTNMVGESFARLREALGASVVRANYQGDVGLHVAKTMYGLKLLFARDGISFEDLKSRDLVERVKYLGEAYMLGFNMYDDVKNPIAIEQVKNINYFIFSLYIPSLEKKEYFRDLKEIEEWYYEGRDWCMEYFERIYERTNTKFDKYFLESEMSNYGLNIVLSNVDEKGNKIFNTDSGSIVYKGDESKGLHTRVFVSSEGLPTYEAKELALAFKKFEDVNFDESVVITANEQSGYFKVVLDALSHLSTGIANRSKHVSHGMVKLPQYVYARCNSILGQVKEVVSQKSSIELDVYSKELIRHISRYESILLSSSLNYSPSTLCTYLFDLGQTFNKFYQNVRVLDSENMEYLLTVVDATAKTIKHGLNVLGIDVVEKM
ncbi:MAG: arginyl-tRNA synthetase, arginyl-tRNA synthetase [candidate division WS6 bacterium GW2011_GWF1_33_233]|nr:MAG: arginyl-tRNA synthetase, arginyl-tRNA synthetase [candidate division WS6 bacterium GW2011_GWF1_33_233]